MAMKQRTRRILWSALAVALLLPAAGLFFRDALASFAAARVLAQRGLQCDPVSVHVPFSLPPSPIVLASTRCTVAEGPLAAIAFKGPLSIHLDGLKPDALTCPSLEIDLRPRARREVDLNTLGDMTKVVGLDQPAVELMFDAAMLSSDRNPPLRAERAVVHRAGKRIASLDDLRVVSGEEAMTVSSPRARVDQAALLGEGELRLTATATAVVVTVVFSGDQKVKVVLDHIDATKPKVDFSIAVGEAKPAH